MSEIRDVAVKVNSGSGVLVSLNNKNYVITAIHCINEQGMNTILSADEKIKYDAEKMFFHPKRVEDTEKKNEGDIVLLLVKGMSHFPSFEMSNNVYVSDEVKAYGFPTKKRDGEPLNGKISQWNKDITSIETNLTYLGSNTDDEKAINNIEGWSGSGVFKEVGGKAHLIGILKGLTTKEHIYQTINCIAIDIIYEVIIEHKLATIEKKNQTLTSLPKINKDFIGRTKQLEKIAEHLKADNVSCVVNGIGGLGKSELSYQYLHKHRNEYNKIAFIELTEEKSLEESIYLKLQDSLNLQEDKSFDTIIKRLQNYPKPNLLLLDNLQNSEDFKKIEPLNINFDILITTRVKVDTANVLELKTLEDEEAQELFLKIYPTRENIDDVLIYLDNHPLFINLTAYSLKEGYIDLDELREDIKEGRVSQIDSKDDKTFQEHLQKTFDKQFQKESNDELKMLLQILSLFPPIAIDLEILKKSIGDKRLKSKLQKLVHRGWLNKKDDSYKLHQIIKTFILEEYRIDYEDIINILENIGTYIDPDDSTLIANKLSDYIPIIDSLLSLFQHKEDEYIASILDSNTYLYYSLGEYSNSLEIQKKSFEIREQLYGDNSEKLAKNSNLLGNIYYAQGKYKEAKPLYEKALKISEEVLGEEHPSTATSYNNLALLYASMGAYEKAEPLFEKALKIREEVLGEEHPDTAISYHNLGLFYRDRKLCLKAKEFLDKAVWIWEQQNFVHPNLGVGKRALKGINDLIKKENKLNYKKRGRFCADMKKS